MTPFETLATRRTRPMSSLISSSSVTLTHGMSSSVALAYNTCGCACDPVRDPGLTVNKSANCVLFAIGSGRFMSPRRRLLLPTPPGPTNITRA